jgi:hypothetical protein
MKKNLSLLIIVLFFYCFTANALELTLGLKVGLARTDLEGNGVSAIEDSLGLDMGSKYGFVGGFLANIGITDMISIQIELLYFEKGAKSSIEEMGMIFTRSLNLNYLEMPLLLKLKPFLSPAVLFEIFAGPTLSLNLIATVANSVMGFPAYTEDISEEIKSTDIGLIFGGGAGFALGSAGILTIEGRYTMGLSSIAEAENRTIKTKNIIVMLSYGFPLGK